MNVNRKIIFAILFVFFCLPGLAQNVKKTAKGIDVSVNNTNISIQFYSPYIVRILKSPDGFKFEKKSLSVIEKPKATILKIDRTKKDISISSNSTRVNVNLVTGQIRFFNKTGGILLEEKRNGLQFIPTKDSTTNTFNVTQAFQLKDDEAIYGLGQHQAGKMNQRNQTILLKQINMQIGIPLFYSVKGYSVFWDNYSSTVFKDDKLGTSFSSEIGDCADYYFINGGSADKVIANFRGLTGQAPMFPKWVFGFWQSRERYKTQYESVGVVKKYRALGVPIDGVVQDWQYWGVDEHYWNSTEFGNPLFPDPKAMIDSVHLLHAHMIISVWPSFGNQTKIFKELKSKGMLMNFTTWPVNSAVQPYDAFNPEARNVYWGYMNRNIFSLGMDGWWLDSTEPDQMRPKPGDDNNETYLGTFRKVRNAYPLVHTGGVYHHQREQTSGKRVFILARSAFAGQQRNATANWSGDVQSRWDVLKNQISGGLNLSLSGIPYWNSDIGGFFPLGKYPNGLKDPAFKELYTRWFEFSAFCPMFRSHGTDVPREIYQFGNKGDWSFDAQEKFINLRYRLLPYNYSNAWSVTSESSTMMRALIMDFANDKKVYDINNEYMFGKAFLVCPVTDSLYTNRANGNTIADFNTIKTQKVYLPNGAEWFDFWTGRKIHGGQEVEKEVPINIIPLYVKAGSIIPMGPFEQYSTEKNDPIEIRIYQGADGTFDLYEDENDNYNYEKGKYSTIHFDWNDKQRILTISDRKGKYSGMPKFHTFNIVVVKDDNGTGLNIGKPANRVRYSGQKATVKIR